MKEYRDLNASEDGKPDSIPWWLLDEQALFAQLQCTGQGLSTQEALLRQKTSALPESPFIALRRGVLLLLRRFASPLVLILLIAGAVSALLGEINNFLIIGSIVVISVSLDTYHEAHSAAAAKRLQDSLAHLTTAVRDGQRVRVPAAQIVPGDLLILDAGGIIPADARLISAKNLLVNQALLTGESYPVEKGLDPRTNDTQVDTPMDAPCAILAGTAVHGGSATAIAVLTGARTELGKIGADIVRRKGPSTFDLDIQRFGTLIMRLTIFLVLFVLLINALFHRPWLESFLFAIALAVGLTPELLPMIVSVTLARGAIRLARKHVIVKHLQVIQNLGTMGILCTDKTGTLTEAEIRLDRTLDTHGGASATVGLLLQVNSHFSGGAKNALDDAVMANRSASLDDWEFLAHLPFDFNRRWAAVLAKGPGGTLLIVKGAPNDVLRVCTQYAPGDDAAPLPLDEPVREQVAQTFGALEHDGFRVLAVASKRMPDECASVDIGDASGLVLHGYAAFRDPPKRGAAAALKALRKSGVQVKIVSGDSELVIRHVCTQLHLPIEGVLNGSELEAMDAATLRSVVGKTTLFCRMTPFQKERVVFACKALGDTVGYLGDGINDAPALHAADAGISVESAAGVAQDAASIILLRHSLSVVHEGVMEGRRTYMNVLKYIMMGTSSNFGNMFSMAGAALFLPFLPMLPVQILLNNMLYDLSELPIPMDNVDAGDLSKPHRLDIGLIRKFMLIVGSVSSVFDFITFYLLLSVLHVSEVEFQTCWFVESLFTQVLVIFVIRTRSNPLRDRPHILLVAASCLVLAVAILLPISPLASLFSFTAPPAPFYFLLGPLVFCYLVAVQVTKRRFFPAETAR